ncbi:MAG: hypothetical protein N2738_07190, partial [Thermodesulfovibrionales bacterium]|nr:hypothetical protein [Thermodesulfovibrionales bacterium]
MKGFFNKYLKIDLTNRSYEDVIIDDSLYEKYLGGKGLATWLLLNHQPEKIAPLSPENPFIIGLGPISDTKIFGSSRYGIYTKSPLTGFFCESYSGGKVPEKISKCGYDAIVIKGKSEELVYLEIKPNEVIFHNASDLKGIDTIHTETILNDRHGKNTGSIVIGPAGESMIPFSIVSNDFWR